MSEFPIAAIESGGSVIVSSVWRSDHRFGYYLWTNSTDQGYSDAWVARVNDQKQWIQISTITGGPVNWIMIKTKGRGNMNQYVTKYSISYTMNGNTWKVYGSPRIFTGNSDMNTIKTNYISPSINAIAIRIHPIEWHSYISMRLEAYYSI